MKRILKAKVDAWRGRMATRIVGLIRVLNDAKHQRTVQYRDFGRTVETTAAKLKGQTVLVGDQKVVVR